MQLEEWKTAQENARHFNDLLLRVRAFGIPVVVTIMGGGVALGPRVLLPNIPVLWAFVNAIGLTLAIFLFTVRLQS